MKLSSISTLSKKLIIDDIKLKLPMISYDFIKKNNCSKNINIVLKKVFSNYTIINLLKEIKLLDIQTYNHSINVGFLALSFGISLNFTLKKLYILFLGAILHDIGKILIPKEILLKTSRLTPLEFDLIKRHPSKGFRYILKEKTIPRKSKLIVLQHHKWINGEGYPLSINIRDLTLESQITAICDVFDALTSERPYRIPLSFNDALTYIKFNSNSQFNSRLVDTFCTIIEKDIIKKL